MSILDLSINGHDIKLNRDLIARVDIDINNWNISKPTGYGLYRVLLYDIDPRFYQLDIRSFTQRGWGYIDNNLIAYWQKLGCSQI